MKTVLMVVVVVLGLIAGRASAIDLTRDNVAAYNEARCVANTSTSPAVVQSLAGHGVAVTPFCQCQAKFLTDALTDREISHLADAPEGVEKLNNNIDTANAFCLGRLGR